MGEKHKNKLNKTYKYYWPMSYVNPERARKLLYMGKNKYNVTRKIAKLFCSKLFFVECTPSFLFSYQLLYPVDCFSVLIVLHFTSVERSIWALSLECIYIVSPSLLFPFFVGRLMHAWDRQLCIECS